MRDWDPSITYSERWQLRTWSEDCSAAHAASWLEKRRERSGRPRPEVKVKQLRLERAEVPGGKGAELRSTIRGRERRFPREKWRVGVQLQRAAPVRPERESSRRTK